jgi:hypothetical protein
MTSDVSIANRALGKLGSTTIVSLTQDSPAARAINAIYTGVRRSEIRKHPWNFAKTRAQLAADADEPAFDFGYQYRVPADCLRVLNKADVDWKIEGQNILSNDGGPLEIIYLADITDPNVFDEAFIEAFASKLAYEIAEKLTSSSEKKKSAGEDYRFALSEARRTNAIERMSEDRIEDDWERARY